MMEVRNPRIMRTIPLLIVVCFVSFPAYAKYGGGTGEPNDPYQIATAEDLMLLGDSPEDYDKHFILTADIDLDPNLPGRQIFTRPVIAPCEGARFPMRGEPTFPTGTTFTGSFNGNGYTVNNLTLDDEGKKIHLLGLFGVIDSMGRVENLGIENASIKEDMSYYIGILAGYSWGQIVNCYATGRITGRSSLGGFVGFNEGIITRCLADVSVIGTEASSVLGGLVGHNGRSGTISYCCATGSVSSGDNGWRLGGLVGYNSGKITNSYATGSVACGENSFNIGGLVGFHSARIIANCYSIGQVTGGNSIGGLVGSSISTVSQCFWDMEASGLSESAGGTGLTTIEMQDANTFIAAGWDFEGERSNGTTDLWQMPEAGGYPVLTVFSESYQRRELSGTGTPEDPYRITTAEDLGAICHYDPSACYRLAADIDLSGITWTTAPIEDFDGMFDGNGLVLSNLTIQGGGFLGLFGYLAPNGTVKNLVIEDANIVGGYNAYNLGTITGQSYGRIAQCSASGNIVAGDICLCLGELTGSNHGTITRCYVTGDVSGGEQSQRLGGLTGDNWGSVVDSHSWVGVSSGRGSSRVGGLVGYNAVGTVANCYAVGCVFSETPSEDHGGLTGDNWNGSIGHCFWDVETSGMSESDGGMGLTTAQMQTTAIFIDAGWDFVGESVNGTEDIWSICEGTNYPRLVWQIPAGDFVCPDGITIDDLVFFIEHWGQETCDLSNDYCQGTDLDFSGTVDEDDLEIFLENWLAVGND